MTPQTTFAPGHLPPWAAKPTANYSLPPNVELSRERRATILEHLRGRLYPVTVAELEQLLHCPGANLSRLLTSMAQKKELQVKRDRVLYFWREA